jgi:hypothetical protein
LQPCAPILPVFRWRSKEEIPDSRPEPNHHPIDISHCFGGNLCRLLWRAGNNLTSFLNIPARIRLTNPPGPGKEDFVVGLSTAGAALGPPPRPGFFRDEVLTVFRSFSVTDASAHPPFFTLYFFERSL